MSIDPQAILNTPMEQNDARATTVRGYLVALAREVWCENEGFSGKRPFGNSGWEHEVYTALAIAGHIECLPDGYGAWEVTREQQLIADKLIYAALDELAAPLQPAPSEAPMAEAPAVLTQAQTIRLEVFRTLIGAAAEWEVDYSARYFTEDILLLSQVIGTGQEPLPALRAEPMPLVQADGTADEEDTR